MLVHIFGCVCLIVSQSSRKMNHDEDRMSLSKVGTPSTRKKLIWSKLSVIQNSKCYARIMKVLVFTYPMIHHSDMEERLAQEVSRARSSKWHCQWQWQWKWQWQFFWKWNQRIYYHCKKNSGFWVTMAMKMTVLHQSYLFAPEVMDICANACEKHWVNASNSQLVCPSLKIYSSLKLFIIQCAQLIKEALDSR